MDGPTTVCALKVVGAELSPEPAPTLHLRMAATLALGKRPSYATHKHVRVYRGGDDLVLAVVVNVVLHGVGASSLTGMSALTLVFVKSRMHEHNRPLLSLTSNCEAAKPKHGKTARGDRAITRTHYFLLYLHQSLCR